MLYQPVLMNHKRRGREPSSGATSQPGRLDPSCDKECSRSSSSQSQPNINSATGTVGRSLNHRAKVTVQRRANTKQKVVSLSFDKAVELSSQKPIIDSQIFCSKSENPASSAGKPEDEDVVTTQTDNSFMLGHSEARVTPASKREARMPAAESYEEEENEDQDTFCPKCCEVVAFTSGEEDQPPTECVEESTTADEVVPFSLSSESASADHHVAPPPIRLRQAWASPTQPRQQKPACASKTKGTNTVSSRRDRGKETERNTGKTTADLSTDGEDSASQTSFEVRPASQSGDTDPGKDLLKGARGDKSNRRDVQSDPDVASKPEETDGDVNSEQGHKKRVEVKLPKASFLSSTGTDAMKNNSRKADAEKINKDESTGCLAESQALNGTGQTKEPKCQGMGDGGNVHPNAQGEDTCTPNSTTVTETATSNDASSSERNFETMTMKSQKTKKKSSSLFSWSPFRKKSGHKQKKMDLKSAATTTNTSSISGVSNNMRSEKSAHVEGEVAKPNMKDILYQQGRVSMPQSLTEMFAASRPGSGGDTGKDGDHKEDKKVLTDKKLNTDKKPSPDEKPSGVKKPIVTSV